MLVTPILIVCLFQGTLPGYGFALALFGVAALSDYLDGRLARQLKAHSRLGRFLDPMADKVLVLGTFVALAFLHPSLIPWWAVAVIAARDLVVTLVRARAEMRGRSVKTLQAAKYKTSVQLVFLFGMLALLTAYHFPGMLGDLARVILSGALPLAALILVVVFSVGTGVWYVVRSEFVPVPGT